LRDPDHRHLPLLDPRAEGSAECVAGRSATRRSSSPYREASVATTQVRLIFADEGTYHAETIAIPIEKLSEYDRLIDLLREEPDVTRQVYVDLKRLVSAYVVGE